MKKLVIILILISSCTNYKNKQLLAEQTITAYIQPYNPKANIKNLHFTKLDLDRNVIGVVEDTIIYDVNHRPIYINTVYYFLSENLKKVTGSYKD